MQKFWAVLGICLLFTSCKKTKELGAEPETPATVQTERIPRIDTVASNLQVPWGLVILPNGDLLFGERNGRISLLKKGQKEAKIIFVRTIFQSGEAGLLGMTIDPQFAVNHFIYVYESVDVNRVTRFKFENDLLSEDKVLVNLIPLAPNHDGGALKFGPDGYLYIGTGDALKPELAQDRNAYNGKILRVDRDGNVPPGNPFSTRIWSYGHRNVQGFCWTSTGVMLATEHGPSIENGWCCHDEINIIKPGLNYGWPLAIGGTEKDSLTPALVQSDFDTWAPSGCAYLDETSPWPNTMVVACLRGQKLIRFRLNASGTAIESRSDTLVSVFHRLRNIIEAQDKSLYFCSSNQGVINPPPAGDDKVYRLILK
jgi:aldose sugar dehydrogenase